MTNDTYKIAVEQLRRSAEFFSGLEAKAVEAKGELAFPPDRDTTEHFLMAAYATSILYALGREELQELAGQEIVHPATVEGGSLTSATTAVNHYFLLGKARFQGDYFEQLARTCQSAANVVELTEGNFLPQL